MKAAWLTPAGAGGASYQRRLGLARASQQPRELSRSDCRDVAIAGVTAHIWPMPPATESTRAKTAKPVAAARSRPLKAGDHLFLVDGSGYIFRAYHALPPLNRKSDGLQVNAVLGFCNMLWKLLCDMKPEETPTHLAVVFDKS